MLTTEKYIRKPMIIMTMILTFRDWWSALTTISPMIMNITMISIWSIMLLDG